MVDSAEEPLVRPVGRNVIPRLSQTVPSEFQCVTVVEASHPGPCGHAIRFNGVSSGPNRFHSACQSESRG